MNKILMRLMALFISAFALICVAPALKAEAKDDFHYYKPVAIEQGKWTTLKPCGYIPAENNIDEYVKYHVYKITIPGGSGYLQIDLKKSKDYDMYPYQYGPNLAIYEKLNPDSYLYNIKINANEGKNSTTDKRILPKGTYYLYEYSGYPVDIRWKFIKVPNYKNYCKTKARKLVRGKTETVVMTSFSFGYDKWYKIKLDKKQYLTLNFNKRIMNVIYLFDSKGNQISFKIKKKELREEKDGYTLVTTKGGKTAKTTEKLKKGTYYLKLCTEEGLYINPDYEYHMFQEYKFSWQ